MPSFRGLTVNVVYDDWRKSLPEYGAQEHNGLMKCYIESKPDLQIAVRIVPEIPYPFRDVTVTPAEHNDRAKHNGHAACQSTVTTRKALARNKLIHLAACLSFDGRKTVERRTFICVDPEQEWFWPQAFIHQRVIKQKDGRFIPVSWSFREAGIERFFDLLSLDKEDKGLDAMEELIGTLSKTTLEDCDDLQEERTKGSIKVEIFRIVVTGSGRKPMAVSEEQVGEAASHGTNHHVEAVLHPERIISEREIVSVKAKVVDKEPLATFEFLYRDKDTMAKTFQSFEAPPSSTKPAPRLNVKRLHEKLAAARAEAAARQPRAYDPIDPAKLAEVMTRLRTNLALCGTLVGTPPGVAQAEEQGPEEQPAWMRIDRERILERTAELRANRAAQLRAEIVAKSRAAKRGAEEMEEEEGGDEEEAQGGEERSSGAFKRSKASS